MFAEKWLWALDGYVVKEKYDAIMKSDKLCVVGPLSYEKVKLGVNAVALTGFTFYEAWMRYKDFIIDVGDVISIGVFGADFNFCNG